MDQILTMIVTSNSCRMSVLKHREISSFSALSQLWLLKQFHLQHSGLSPFLITPSSYLGMDGYLSSGTVTLREYVWNLECTSISSRPYYVSVKFWFCS